MGRTDVDVDEAYPTVLSHMRPTDKLWVAVTRLVREDVVEARDVPVEPISSPDPRFDETETVVHFAYGMGGGEGE